MVKIKLKGGLIDRKQLLRELYRLAMERSDGKCRVTKIINYVETMEAKDATD